MIRGSILHLGPGWSFHRSERPSRPAAGHGHTSGHGRRAQRLQGAAQQHAARLCYNTRGTGSNARARVIYVYKVCEVSDLR